MKKSSFGKHCIIISVLAACALLCCALLVIVVDPFFQYHKPINGLYYQIDNKMSQNAGMAKNFDYDSVIVGSSMTVNFDTNVFAETMGLNTIKLSHDGAYARDIDHIMEIVKDTHSNIKKVFLGIDVYIYKKGPDISATALPTYLYDNNYLNDVSYLFNKEVILEYIVKPQVEKEGTALNEVYWSWDEMEFGPAAVAKTYEAPTEFVDSLPVDSFKGGIAASMTECIIPYIESMPDTDFVVFFPPYGVLYWYYRYADGSLAAEIEATKQITEMLLEYPNVEVYYFQDQFDYITDLNNYSDYSHYNHDMNDYMTYCFADGTHRLTKENYQQVLADMLAWLNTCDFESYIP